MHPAALFFRLRPDFAERLPKPQRAIGDRQFWRDGKAPAFQVKKKTMPIFCAFTRADDDEDRLTLFFKPVLQINAVRPDVNISGR
jgi:hypothetical protein